MCSSAVMLSIAAVANPSSPRPPARLLVDCNRLAVDIDNEMAVVHAFIKDKYRLKFPELESLVGRSGAGLGGG